MFKVMKQNQGHTDKVCSFSLREVCSFSGERLSPEEFTQNTRENKPEDLEKPLETDRPSEKEMEARFAEIEQNAHEKGFASGEKAGHALGMEKLKPLQETLLNVISEVQNLKESIFKECEEDIIAMVLAISRRILGHDLKISPETLFGYIKKGMTKIGEEERLLIRLHPHDLERMTKASDSLTALLESGKRFRFEPDHSLSPGECIMESRERVVDARPRTQLAFFEAALAETKSS